MRLGVHIQWVAEIFEAGHMRPPCCQTRPLLASIPDWSAGRWS